MDITRRLRAVERDLKLAHVHASPVSTAQRRFDRLCRDMANAGLNFRAYEKRVAAIRRQLGLQ